VDTVAQAWVWVLEHPASVAWIAFAILSAVVTAYRVNERAIKTLAAATKTTADDKAVRVLDGLVAVFEVIRLFAPHGLARPAEDDEE